MESLKQLIEQRAKELGEATFLYWNDAEVSYAEANRRANRFGNYLGKKGLAKGDRVAILLANRPEFLWAWFGCMKRGLVSVPVNALFKPDEIAYVIANSGARALVTEERFAPYLDALKKAAPELEHVVVVDDGAWREGTPGNPRVAVKGEDRASIVYTSGTTGKPKGAVLRQGNYVWDAAAIVKVARMGEGDRFVCILPLFHVNAQVVTVLAPLTGRSSMVLLPQFSPKDFLQHVARTKATAFSAVPTVYAILLTLPAEAVAGLDLSHLRFAICGGAPMPVEVFKRFEQKFKISILEGYGLSEGTCASSVNPLPEDGERKIGSIGLPLEGQDMAIMDEQGRPLEDEKIGEIVVRGPNVMVEYYKNPEATAATIKEGWLHTGDLGKRDAGGYYWIQGRKKEMIIRGGENIYPKEIEEVAYRHPAIAEAAVVGLPDKVWGERVALFAVLKPGAAATEAEVIAYAKEHLADYKCPVEVHFKDALPKTATGKHQKPKIIEQWRLEAAATTPSGKSQPAGAQLKPQAVEPPKISPPEPVPRQSTSSSSPVPYL